MQNVNLFRQDLCCALVAFFNNLTNFLVDGVGNFLRVALFRCVATTKENFPFATVEKWTNLVAHTPLGNHLVRKLCKGLDISACTATDVFDNQFFRNASTKCHNNLVEQLLLCNVVVVVFRTSHCVTSRLATWDDCNFVNGIAVLQSGCQNCMTCFVVGCDALVWFGNKTGLLLWAHNNLVDTFVYVIHCDNLSAGTYCQDSRFVQKVFEVGTGKARCDTSNRAQVNVCAKWLFACVNLQDCFTATNVWAVYVDLSIETTWAQKRWVQNVCAVGCSHNDDVCACVETVHLNQKLVQRLFSFVVTATKACTTLTTNGVDFVNKDDTRHVFLCLLEQISNTACAYADKHFHKVGTTHGEEWYASLTGNCLCEQCFTSSWRAYKKYTLGDTRAHIYKALWILQKVYNFSQFFLFFFGTGNVSKANLHVGYRFSTRVAKIHVLVVLTCNGAEQEDAHKDDHTNVQNWEDVVCPTTLVGVCGFVYSRCCAVGTRLEDKCVEACSVCSYKCVSVSACILTVYSVAV